MANRRPPKEAVREGHRARLAGVDRSRNPYDRPIVLTRTNGPEFRAAARLREAWFSGWDSAHALSQPTAAAQGKKRAGS